MKKSQLKAIIRECIEEMDEGIVDTAKKGYHKVAAKYHGNKADKDYEVSDRDYGDSARPRVPMRKQLSKTKAAAGHLKKHTQHSNRAK